jgi:hypothetical protein
MRHAFQGVIGSMNYAAMHYHPDDIHHLMRNVPYTTFMRPLSGLYRLRRQAHAVKAWCVFIPLYRSVRCEPLDFFYTYLQCLGAFDELLLKDLLTTFTWRGIVWGSLLAALAPQTNFRDHLLEARPKAPHNQWIVDLALAVLDQQQSPEFAEPLDLLRQIREALAPLPKPVIKLRRCPGPLSQLQFQKAENERSIIRDLYHKQGVDAARAYLAASSIPTGAAENRNWRECVIDNGEGDGTGPKRDVWFWGFTV